MSKRTDFEYLDDERKKLWAELLIFRDKNEEARKRFQEFEKQLGQLEEIVEKKPTDLEREARSACAQTTKYKNRAEESAKRIDASAASVAAIVEEADSIKNKLLALDSHHEEAVLHYEASKLAYSELLATQAKLASMNAEINAALEGAEEDLKLSTTASIKIDEVKVATDSLFSKITTIHSQAAKRGQELNSLHDEIFGYTYKDDETGEETEAPGLKAELELSHDRGTGL
jgi:chromosome segregation ATPase